MITEKPWVMYECVAEEFDNEGETKTVYGIKRKDANGSETVFRAVSSKKQAVLGFIALLEDYESDKRTFKYLVEDFLA